MKIKDFDAAKKTQKTEPIGEAQYGLIVFDEAHNLKNAEAAKTLAGNKIKQRADHVVFATATPMDRWLGAAYFISEVTAIPLQRVGHMLGFTIDENGVPRLMAGATPQTVKANILNMREAAVRMGAFIRREYPFAGTTQLKTIRMNAQESDIEKKILGYFGDLAASLRAGRNYLGQMVQSARHFVEHTKINEALRLAEASMAAGRRPIIVAEFVNPSDRLYRPVGKEWKAKFHDRHFKGEDVKIPGTMEELERKLADKGITDIARIYGDFDKAAERSKFQAGKARILLMTPTSGGTGINLDDVGGQARDMIVLSNVWAGDTWEQLIGRISRRNTVSTDNTVTVLNAAQSYGDERSMQVVLRKIATVKAIQSGQDIDASTIFPDTGYESETDEPLNSIEAAVSGDETLQAIAPDSPVPWLANTGQTGEGRSLITKIKNDKRGMKYGVRSISAFLDKVFKIETRVGREQIGKKAGAHYEPKRHLIRLRASGDSLSFHEIGHGLWNLIKKAISPRFMASHYPALVELTLLPGSRASAHNEEEGFAEWVRLYVLSPESIADMSITAAIEAEITKANPAFLSALKDAARAYKEHTKRDILAIKRSFDNDQRKASWVEAGKAFFETFGQAWVSSFPLEMLERRMFNALRAAKETQVLGLALARKWRDSIFKPVFLARKQILAIPAEIHEALHGRANGKNGIRYLNEKGNWEYLTDKSVEQIYKMIPAEHRQDARDLFQMAAEVARYAEGKLEYPGISAGMTPNQMAARVQRAFDEIKGFREALKALKEYHDGLVQLAVLSGEKTREEADRIRSKYVWYVPLFKVQEREVMPPGAGRGPRMPSAGLYGARGSEQGLLPLDDSIKEATRRALRAYYWNESLKALHRSIVATSNEKDVPFVIKAAYERIMVSLHLDRKKVATIKEEESEKFIELIIKALAEQDIIITADELNLTLAGQQIWRAKAPRAVNVVAYWKNGERRFFQIEYPWMFRMYAEAQAASPVFGFLGQLGRVIADPWKRAITQFILFPTRNIPRDMATAIQLGKGPERYLAGIYHVVGFIGRLANIHPEVKQSTEMFSRTLEAVTGREHILANNSFMRMLRTGILLDGWRFQSIPEKVVALMGTASALVTKPIDVFNWITGGLWLSGTTEALPREGGAIIVKWRGGSDQEAAAAYRTITGEFSERSGYADVAIMAKAAGFTNAILQVTYQQLSRLFLEPDPARRAANQASMLVIAGYSAAGWAILQMLMDDDDDERQRKRKTQDRMRFMDLKGVRIPFPDGLAGTVASFTWNMLDHHLGEKPLRQRKVIAGELAKKAFSNFDVGFSDFIQPQLKALIEAKTGYSFFLGKRIEPGWMETSAPELRAYADTPGFYKKLGEMFGWSPLRIQHIVRQGVARQYDEVLSYADKVRKGKPITENADLPLVGRLFIRNPTGWNSQPVAELQDYEAAIKTLKTRLIEDGMIQVTDAGAIVSVHPAIESQWTQLMQLHKAYNLVKRLGAKAKDAEEAGNIGSATMLKTSMVIEAQAALASLDEFDRVTEEIELTVNELSE